jgi:hypothetical protein
LKLRALGPDATLSSFGFIARTAIDVDGESDELWGTSPFTDCVHSSVQ